MSGLNRWEGIGNLGADPELRYTQGGQPVLNLRVACTEKYKDRSGELKEITEWVGVVVWGARAEGLARILGKGARIYAEGQLRTSKFEDKEGVTRYRTEVNAREIILCGGATRSDGGSTSSGTSAGDGGGATRQTSRAPQDAGGYGSDDSDIPF